MANAHLFSHVLDKWYLTTCSGAWRRHSRSIFFDFLLYICIEIIFVNCQKASIILVEVILCELFLKSRIFIHVESKYLGNSFTLFVYAAVVCF